MQTGRRRQVTHLGAVMYLLLEPVSFNSDRGNSLPVVFFFTRPGVLLCPTHSSFHPILGGK